MKRKAFGLAIFTAAMLAFAASAGAVDGTIEINQAKVTAAGGFPYIIDGTKGHSYRLTGDLTVPGGKDGIDVSASYVTIDLNGFEITTPGGPSASGIQIKAAQIGMTVENGTVSGFSPGYGVATGDNAIVKSVHAEFNSYGIFAGNNAVIQGCTANSNVNGIVAGMGSVVSGNVANSNTGADGIFCAGSGCTISGNTANSNANGTGIECNLNGCMISGNVANGNTNGIVIDGNSSALIISNTMTNNTHYGLAGGFTSVGYMGNMMSANGTANVGGTATSMGHNICSGAVC